MTHFPLGTLELLWTGDWGLGGGGHVGGGQVGGGHGVGHGGYYPNVHFQVGSSGIVSGG